MKTPIPTHIPLAISVAGFFLAAGPLLGDQLLFADSFNRANSSITDGSALNESAAGKSGPLGALTWTGRTSLLATGNIVDINSNRLRMDAVDTNGNNGGLAYISDHNFIDASIKSAGTFKVSIDISSVASVGDGRYLGFGIGQSLAELDALASAAPTSYPSDVYIGYDNIGATRGIAVFHNGTNVTSPLLAFPVGTPSLPDTLSAVFTFADMNVGTQLNYAIFLDGSPVGTGSTTWGATDQNYISVTSTYSNPSTFDNFLVTVPGPPVIVSTAPADNATDAIPSANLVATFDEPIVLGAAGSVTIRNLTNPSDTVISLPGPDPDGTLVVSGLDLIIDPTTDLVPGDEYVIEISSGTVADLSSNGFTGLLESDNPNWSFTTDGTPPLSTAMGPMTAAIGAQRGTDLTLSFDESVLAVAGKTITIHLQDGTPVETIDASAAVISGGQVTIPVSIDLGLGMAYYVTVEAGAFTDFSGNPYAGIAGSGGWTFTTAVTDITYVDAVPGGNTYATGSNLADLTWVGPDSGATSDTQWNQRASVESNGDFLYQGSSITTPPPELTTEISGLADGVYTIWGFYWDQVIDNSQNWVLSAGLAPGSLTTYRSPGEPSVSGATTAGVTNATALSFTSSVTAEAAFDLTNSVYLRNLFGVEVGQVEVSGGAAVKVHIGNNLTTGTANRAWYDGVGYQLVANSPPTDLAITSFTAVGGGVWELALKGAAGGIYEFRSSTTLNFNPGTLVESLVLAGPGTIGGPNNSQVTTNGSGLATVRINLGSAPKNFVRAQTAP